jgi:hypothetical protein
MVENMNVSLSRAETKQAALSSLPPTCSMGTNRSYRSQDLDLMSATQHDKLALDLQEITLFEVCTRCLPLRTFPNL